MSTSLQSFAIRLVALWASTFALVASAEPVYRIEAIRTPVLSRPSAINNRGAITGYAFAPLERAAVMKADGSVRLHAPMDGLTFGDAINDHGVVAVTVLAGPVFRARIWQSAGGRSRDLGTLGGTQCTAQAINNEGQVVGASSLADGRMHAYISDALEMRDLGTLGGAQSSAFGINDAGQVTGDSQRADGSTHAFIEHDGAMTDLGDLGGGYSTGAAINALGHVVGTSTPIAGLRDHDHAFVWDGTRMRDIGTLGGKFSAGQAINRFDEVVGISRFFDERDPAQHAYLYTGGVMYSLMDLLDASRAGWSNLINAGSINDAGDIVGLGLFNGVQTPYLARRVMSAPASNWRQVQHDASQSGVNRAETAFTSAGLRKPLEIAFKAHYGDGTFSGAGAVEAGGMLYIADSGSEPDFAGRVSAFDASGCGADPGGSCEPIWQGLTGGSISTTPAVGNGFVMVASRASTSNNAPFLFGFGAHGCGRAMCPPAWRGVLQDAAVGSTLVIANGIAYVGDFGGRLVAFDAVDCGARHDLDCPALWTGRAGPKEELTTAPVVGPNFVLVSSFLVDPNVLTGRLNAFKVGGCGRLPDIPCAPAWTADIGGPGAGQTLSGSTVFVGSGTLFGNGFTSKFHMLAFDEAGCGAEVCGPIRVYDTGDVDIFSGVLAAPVVVGDTLLVSTQYTPRVDTTTGVVSAYSASGTTGCVQNRCKPIWTGASSPPTNGSTTPPAVAGDVVFAGRYPATGFQVIGNDAGVFAFNVNGCGAGRSLCMPLSLTQVGLNQINFGAPLAVARGTVFHTSNDNDDNHSNVYALKPP